MPLNLFH